MLLNWMQHTESKMQKNEIEQPKTPEEVKAPEVEKSAEP